MGVCDNLLDHVLLHELVVDDLLLLRAQLSGVVRGRGYVPCTPTTLIAHVPLQPLLLQPVLKILKFRIFIF